MRNMLNVAWFTIKETIRKKSFLISNIFILAVIFIIFNVINFLFGNYVLSPDNSNTVFDNTISSVDDGEKTNATFYNQTANSITNETLSNSVVVDLSDKGPKKPNIAVFDSENILGDFISLLPNDKINFFEEDILNLDSAKEKIQKGEIYAAINIFFKNDEINFDYIVFEESSDMEKELNYITNSLRNVYLSKIASDNNLSDEVLNSIKTNISYNIAPIVVDEELSMSIIVGLLISFVLFMSIYLYGYSISLSISSEKNSRIIETLVTSASPSHIVIGKTIGMGLLGLAQLVVMILFTLWCYNTYIPSGIDIVNIYLSDINLSTFSIVMIFVYFILGYTLYAFLNAVTGAIVSKTEDVQIVNLPLYFISMLSFYLSFFTIDSSGTKLDTFVNLFPLSSPFAMPSKIIGGLASNYTVAASIILLIFTTILLAFISIRIYSVAILHYGNKMKIKDIFNIFIKFK